MADIEVKIKLNSGVDGDKVNSVSSQYEANNVSIQKTGTAYNKLSTKNNGTNMKSWATGSLSLADGFVGGLDSVLVEQYGYNGYIFGVVPENNEFSVTLTITGENLDSLIFYGDKEANQFPTKAYLDGNTSNLIYSDDVEWAVKFANPSSTHTITFLEWNRANYNACLTFIGTIENWLTLDKLWIKSVETLSQSTSQPKEIFYGVVPSRGSIELIDRNGEIRDYIEDGILPVSNFPIELYANGKLTYTHITEDSDYTNNNILSINMTDELSNWDTIDFNGMNLQGSLSLYEILKIVLSSIKIKESDIDNMLLGYVYGGIGDTYIKRTIKEHLESIVIPYAYLEHETIRGTIQKICNIAQLTVIKDDDGNTVFVSMRPTGNIEEKVIDIKKSNVFGDPTEDIIVRNAIDKVSIDYNKVVFTNEDLISVKLLLNSQNTNSQENSIKYLLYYIDEVQNNDILPTTRIDGIAHEISTPTKESYSTMDGTISKQSLFYCIEKEMDGFSYLNNGVLEISREYNYYKQLSDDEDLTVGYFNTTTKVVKEESHSEIAEYSSIKSFLETFFDVIDRPPYIEKDYRLKEEYRGTTQYGVVKTFNGDRFKITLLMILPFRDYTVIQEGITQGTIRQISLSYEISLKYDILSTESLTYNYNTSSQVDRVIDSNELIQTTNICGTLAKNLVSDYSNGIRTNKLTVSCVDYYYTDGTQAKNWVDGDVIKVGELVQLEGKHKIWRVTGRNFRKVGVPMIDLELQEVKIV